MPTDSAGDDRSRVTRVVAPGAAPIQWMLLLHGVLGRGTNWRSIARQVVALRPEWGIAMADLRLHGVCRDQGEAPHTLARAAADLLPLHQQLPIRAVAGHSLGAKVAVHFAQQSTARLVRVWVLDADLSSDPAGMGYRSGAAQVLALVESIDVAYATHAEVVDAIVSRGHGRPFAQWLAMNWQRRADGKLWFALKVPAIRELLTSYFHDDLWDAAQQLPGLRFVFGEQSSTVSPQAKERAADFARVHLISGAGHWLHVDDPNRLVHILADDLP